MPYVSAGVAGPEISDGSPCQGGSVDKFVVKIEGLGEYLYAGRNADWVLTHTLVQRKLHTLWHWLNKSMVYGV